MSDPLEPAPAPPPTSSLPNAPYSSQSGLEGGQVPWTGLSLLIVVAGLILFMAVPLRPPSAERIAALRAELSAERAIERLELAVGDYRHDHGEYPGAHPSPAPSLAPPEYDEVWFERQLRMASSAEGSIAPVRAGEYEFGPYLAEGLPLNPMTGLRTVRILREGESFDSIRDGIYGWLYRPQSGEVRAHRLPFTRKHATTPRR